jgi:hypothetical protein
MATISLYESEPPYSVFAVNGLNELLWSYPLSSIHNDDTFNLAAVNLDGDQALEVVVVNGDWLLVLDPAN